MGEEKLYDCNFTCEDYIEFSVLCQQCRASNKIVCCIKDKCHHCAHEFSNRCHEAEEE
jgi:hypothetical protein